MSAFGSTLDVPKRRAERQLVAKLGHKVVWVRLADFGHLKVSRLSPKPDQPCALVKLHIGHGMSAAASQSHAPRRLPFSRRGLSPWRSQSHPTPWQGRAARIDSEIARAPLLGGCRCFFIESMFKHGPEPLS